MPAEGIEGQLAAMGLELGKGVWGGEEVSTQMALEVNQTSWILLGVTGRPLGSFKQGSNWLRLLRAVLAPAWPAV